MYCTPQEFCSTITPLDLTDSSQSSFARISKQEKPPGFRNLDQRLHQGLKGQFLVKFWNTMKIKFEGMRR